MVSHEISSQLGYPYMLLFPLAHTCTFKHKLTQKKIEINIREYFRPKSAAAIIPGPAFYNPRATRVVNIFQRAYWQGEVDGFTGTGDTDFNLTLAHR